MGEVIEIRDAFGALLQGARYDEGARFPAGFRPQNLGMVSAVEH